MPCLSEIINSSIPILFFLPVSEVWLCAHKEVSAGEFSALKGMLLDATCGQFTVDFTFKGFTKICSN